MALLKNFFTFNLIEKIKASLGIKLFIFLSIVIILAIGPLTFSALHALNSYGEKVISLSEQQIRSLAISSLQQISRERADRYQGYFDRIAASAALLGSQASAIYADIPFFAKKPLYEYTFQRSKRNGIWMNTIEDPMVSMYWGAPQMSAEIVEEMRALSHLTPLFIRALHENPEVLASHTITDSGIGLYCTNNRRYKAAAFAIPPTSVFDLRQGEPMTIFTANPDPETNVRWTNIYKDDVVEGFMLTASAPVYDHHGVFRSIVGIDIPLLSVIDDILHQLQNKDDNLILFSFLIDGAGKTIAVPHEHHELLGLSIDRSAYNYSSDRLNTYLWDSQIPDVREMAYDAIANDQHSTELSLQSHDYFIVTSKMEKHGWIFGVVAREQDILSSVLKSRRELERTVSRMTVRGIFFSLMTVCIAIVIIYTLLKHLITPLRKLAGLTEEVAAGNLEVRSSTRSTDEAGVLAQSFNSMVAQLQIARQEQQVYADTLEQKVELKNSALMKQKNELEKIILRLNSEVERRQIVAEAFRSSQQQYYDLLESVKAGVYIVDRTSVRYVNPSLFRTIFRCAREDLVGRNPLDLVSEEDRLIAGQNMEKLYNGVDIPPYILQFQRLDGSIFYGEVWSRASLWEGRKVLVSTLTDVSMIRKNEERLKVQDLQLQKSLEEKEVLLKEIYHRTKNNMLVIISMLELQSEDIDDQRLKIIFREVENRIRAMALVHEKLYQSKNLARIDAGAYLQELANSLLQSMILDGRVFLEVDLAPIAIDIDCAIPLGLVTNEIITNAIRHAFPGKRTGTISLSIGRNVDDDLVLVIADNGIGLSEEIDVASSSSFGMGIIITSLVKIQLKGNITVDRHRGTRYTITFPEPRTVKRI